MVDNNQRSLYKQIKKRTIPEEVATQIQTLVREGHFKTNDQLPGERELAELLKVNRSTVREALRILEVMRVVDIRQGEGAFINAIEETSIESVVFQFLSEDGLDMETLRDVFEAVMHVESAMAKLAAQRITDEEIIELQVFLNSPYKKHYADADQQFHLLVNRIAKSQTLSRIAHTHWIIMKRYAELLFEKPGTVDTAQAQHRDIAASIMRREDAEAARLMHQHLAWAWEANMEGVEIKDSRV